MRWVLFVIIVVQQAADVATTEIGIRAVPGFYEANPFMRVLAGSPPDLYRMILVKVAMLAIMLCLMRWLGKSRWIHGYLIVVVVAYAAIIWNNIGVIA